MATQGQRRREAVAAVRRARQSYRKADSAGEKVERELDRLIKRKTLIGPDSLVNLGGLIELYNMEASRLNSVFRDLVIIIGGLPR